MATLALRKRKGGPWAWLIRRCLAFVAVPLADGGDQFRAMTPSGDARRDGLFVYTRSRSPLAKRLCDSVYGVRRLRPLIVALFFLGCPPAVFGAIVPVDVNPINGCFVCWARPHVRVETFKRIAPSFANLNAPPAVVLVCRTVRVDASVFNAEPSIVFFGSGHAVSAVLCGRQFGGKAFAGPNPAINKWIGTCLVDVSAVAKTTPPSAGMFAVVWRAGDNNKPAEPLSSKVNKPSHSNHCLVVGRTIITWLRGA